MGPQQAWAKQAETELAFCKQTLSETLHTFYMEHS